MELHELAADRVKWGAKIKVKGVATTQGDEQFGRPKEMGMKVPRLHMHWVMARGQGWKFTHCTLQAWQCLEAITQCITVLEKIKWGLDMWSWPRVLLVAHVGNKMGGPRKMRQPAHLRLAPKPLLPPLLPPKPPPLLLPLLPPFFLPLPLPAVSAARLLKAASASWALA